MGVCASYSDQRDAAREKGSASTDGRISSPRRLWAPVQTQKLHRAPSQTEGIGEFEWKLSSMCTLSTEHSRGKSRAAIIEPELLLFGGVVYRRCLCELCFVVEHNRQADLKNFRDANQLLGADSRNDRERGLYCRLLTATCSFSQDRTARGPRISIRYRLSCAAQRRPTNERRSKRNRTEEPR